MKKTIVTLMLLTTTVVMNAQTIFGKWENRDEDTGKVDSVIEVYEKDGKAYAKIVEISNKDRQNAVCDKCTDDRKDQKILGMDILTGLSKDDDEWSGGEILDPKKGKIYSCFIKLKGKDKLKVRGYIGAALFGRTVYWHRKK
ncbi:signal peptide protein [Tenacibaculum holothuriorum]|uniref:Signal peptide protein n=1 Tax=Tenacibaculum holothuriorum TaxID=1635173 RepID=A0A1Y2PBW8_9FLAO|nr:DUF2147 domain-containing protein [Tenacibaculum holothuriorum]OSY87670.1 signal peptide protein [Tenacibaculum holothuriorum]